MSKNIFQAALNSSFFVYCCPGLSVLDADDSTTFINQDVSALTINLGKRGIMRLNSHTDIRCGHCQNKMTTEFQPKNRTVHLLNSLGRIVSNPVSREKFDRHEGNISRKTSRSNSSYWLWSIKSYMVWSQSISGTSFVPSHWPVPLSQLEKACCRLLQLHKKESLLCLCPHSMEYLRWGPTLLAFRKGVKTWLCGLLWGPQSTTEL